MKKSLLALAVLGAFAGAASAQTNVTIYGIADVGIQHTKFDTPGLDESKTEMASGIKNGSRLGFKGSEDLGGGLSAIFTLENGFDLDDGDLGQGGRLFGRQAWVGLNGGFGAVKFGRQNTPMHNALDSIDPFATGFVGNIENTFNGGYLNDVRMSNTVNYSLPTNLGGFFGEAAYGFGEATGSTSADRQLGFSFGYANGPIRAVLAYHNAKSSIATGEQTSRSTTVGGTYDFGVVKAHAAYADNKGAGASIGTGFITAIQQAATPSATASTVAAGLQTAFGVSELKSRDGMLGVSAPVGGAGTVMASWQRKDFRDLADGFDSKVDVLAIGYIHNLSKRTNVYTALGRQNFEFEAPGVDSESKLTQFQVGLQHRF